MSDPSEWLRVTQKMHARTPTHVHVCPVCGAAWEDKRLEGCTSTACYDCRPHDIPKPDRSPPDRYPMSAKDERDGCRGD